MAEMRLPSFDLVVATVGRSEEMRRLLASLEAQTHTDFRVLIVDQNVDGRLHDLLEERRSLDLVHLRSDRGLSRARNVALPLARADVVAFPDDDCVFPVDLLERVARRLQREPALDGLTGRAANAQGNSTAAWEREGAALTRDNLWNRAISFTIFLRAAVIEQVGAFDEALGLGSGRASSSGEEIEYLVRAVDAGAQIEYDPSLVVLHPEKTLSTTALRSLGARDGAAVGYILRKHHYSPRTVARMIVRPAAGALVALARGDAGRAAFHVSTLSGRLRGYRTP
jgi:GT2 family glycosyltransferase